MGDGVLASPIPRAALGDGPMVAVTGRSMVSICSPVVVLVNKGNRPDTARLVIPRSSRRLDQPTPPRRWR